MATGNRHLPVAAKGTAHGTQSMVTPERHLGPEERATILDELLEEMPERDNLWPRLTWYLFRANRLDAARKAAMEALARKPDNPFSRVHLASIHLRLGEPQTAMRWVEEALSRSPQKPELRRLRERIRKAMEIRE